MRLTIIAAITGPPIPKSNGIHQQLPNTPHRGVCWNRDRSIEPRGYKRGVGKTWEAHFRFLDCLSLFVSIARGWRFAHRNLRAWNESIAAWVTCLDLAGAYSTGEVALSAISARAFLLFFLDSLRDPLLNTRRPSRTQQGFQPRPQKCECQHLAGGWTQPPRWVQKVLGSSGLGF